MKITPRRVNIAMLAIAFIVLPPLASRALPDLLNISRSTILGVAVCYAAAAISLNVLMGYAGQISLGHGALLGVGAFASGLITTRGPTLPIPVGFIVAAIAGGVIALAIGFPSLRLRGLYLAIATVGFTLAMEQSVFKWNVLTRGSAGIELPRRLISNVVLTKTADFLPVALLTLLAFWLVDYNIVRSKLGRAFNGIRESEEVAQSFGVDVARYKLLAFVISGAMAGTAGALFGHLIGVVNSETFKYSSWSLLLVMLVVIGGLGTRWGVVIAGIFFGIMPHILKWITKDAQGWELVVGSALLVYTVARHPGGFAGAIHEARLAKGEKLARQSHAEATVQALPSFPRPTGGIESKHQRVLEVKGLTVRYGGLVAVGDADLEVHRGQIVGLIGPNGAGKTTLFNAVSGFVRPQAGTIRLNGADISSLAPFERSALGMGRTFQLIGLAKNLSVLENFLLAQHQLAPYGVGSSLMFLPSAARKEEELIEKSKAAIEALGFTRYADLPVKNLSHGQQRLVELGCALITAPDLLLLDEPSAGFSPAAVENLTDRLRDIRDDFGRTILLIEHNIPMVLDLCDYIYVLNFGQVLAQGSRDEIASHPEVIAAYLGEQPELMASR
ncbi:MAG TPA: branched-chain amino acid ABC transporter ATP-binding protein/permease [Actinomycetota bacterium]|nr:branched-chain amino acid ABC transporter ATP-binding protein/permease [Actinomycetota bacterium]